MTPAPSSLNGTRQNHFAGAALLLADTTTTTTSTTAAAATRRTTPTPQLHNEFRANLEIQSNMLLLKNSPPILLSYFQLLLSLADIP